MNVVILCSNVDCTRERKSFRAFTIFLHCKVEMELQEHFKTNEIKKIENILKLVENE